MPLPQTGFALPTAPRPIPVQSAAAQSHFLDSILPFHHSPFECHHPQGPFLLRCLCDLLFKALCPICVHPPRCLRAKSLVSSLSLERGVLAPLSRFGIAIERSFLSVESVPSFPSVVKTLRPSHASATPLQLFCTAKVSNHAIPGRFLPQRNAKNAEIRTYVVFLCDPCVLLRPFNFGCGSVALGLLRLFAAKEAPHPCPPRQSDVKPLLRCLCDLLFKKPAPCPHSLPIEADSLRLLRCLLSTIPHPSGICHLSFGFLDVFGGWNRPPRGRGL